jgi:peptide/nickel transport system substrate-binding protein
METKKSSRYYFWLIEAFLKKHYPIIIIGFVIGFLLSSLLSTFQLKLPEIQKKTMIGVIGNYDISTLPIFIQTKLSRGLTKFDENGNIVGDLAEDIKIEDSGKKYIYTLKDNIRWQDKKLFTSKDVNYNFKDVSIETPSDKTIAYTLKDSFAPFQALTTQPIFRPSLMGLGEYKLVGFKMGKQRIDFITIKEIKTGKETVYKFYPSETAAVTGFKLGEINSIEEIKDKKNIENLDKVKVTPIVNKNSYVAVFANLRDETLQDKAIRQALAYAIPEEIKNGNRAISPYSVNSWVYNENVKKYDFNLDNAKKLIGKNKNASGSAEMKFSLTAIDTYKETAEKLKEGWKQIGINIELQFVKTKPENFQLLLASSAIPQDPDQYSIWHSTQNTNITGYQSPKVDKLLEDGRKIIDKSQRKQIYLDLQKALLEDLPAIFLYYPTTYRVER